MIVFEDRELVIITPPHTASGNLHRACSALGARWVLGPTPDGAGCDHHTAAVATGWQGYRVAVVARHPLDRLIGLYEHHQYAGTINGWDPLAWWQFVAMVLQRHPDLSWFYRTTISDLIGDLRIDHVIEFDRLADEVGALLGEPIKIAEPWTGDRDLPSFHRQIGICLQAEHWGAADMERFGYSSRL